MMQCHNRDKPHDKVILVRPKNLHRFDLTVWQVLGRVILQNGFDAMYLMKG